MSLLPHQWKFIEAAREGARITITYQRSDGSEYANQVGAGAAGSAMKVCYEPALLIDYPDTPEAELQRFRKEGRVTNDRSLVTCKLCLEWMHA